VTASPLYHPLMAARDAHTLSELSGGRFDFGLGTGRPDVAADAVRLLGRPELSAAGRLAQVAQTIDELRALDGDAHTPVTIAAGGPKARSLAAARADRVTLAGGPLATREEIAAQVAEVRKLAGGRAGTLEFASVIFVVGDEVPPWVRGFLQADAETLIEKDSLVILRGGPQAMADELRRRRETLGFSSFVVNGAFLEDFAPVVSILAGQ
jgi:alkanesulfonate monooxygenase SsuD/methylene tetrahydromethanopterin reductase-like flavin-dependent oxidoreductase (luciferase family)